MDTRELARENLLMHLDLLRGETDQLLALAAELPLESRLDIERLHLRIENIVNVMRRELNRAKPQDILGEFANAQSASSRSKTS